MQSIRSAQPKAGLHGLPQECHEPISAAFPVPIGSTLADMFCVWYAGNRRCRDDLPLLLRFENIDVLVTPTGHDITATFENRILLYEDVAIAGTTHIHDIDRIVKNIKIDSRLRFERDPENLHDRWAIKVFAENERIGFVPCDTNEILSRLMDGGKRVFGKLVDTERLGTWNKLHMEVYLDD